MSTEDACNSAYQAVNPTKVTKRKATDDQKPYNQLRRKRTKQIKKGKEIIQVTEDDISKMIHIKESILRDSIVSLVQSLGFIPYNLVKIAHISPAQNNTATIIQLYPLNTYENNNYHGRFEKGHHTSKNQDCKRGESVFPFPTMYWLACPFTATRVAELEEDGWVNKLEERLNSDPLHQEQMQRAHKAYSEERWLLLSAEDQQYVIDHHWTNPVKEVGIAGIRNFLSVKCLHCHYAHHLARPDHRNLIGQWVEELLSQVKTDDKKEVEREEIIPSEDNKESG